MAPELIHESQQFYARATACAISMDLLQSDVDRKSRDFFQLGNERLVRHIASLSEFFPEGVEIRAEPNGSLSVANIHSFPGDAYEGLLSAMTEDGKVRGTRTDFPVDGPSCKYIALFDRRPIFDHLRKAFLLHAGVESKPSTFLSLLEMLDIERKHRDFADALRGWATSSLPMEHPPDFGRRAWPAYLLAISRASYFLAADELIAVCMLLDVSIAISKEVRGMLTFVDGWFDSGGHVVCAKLTANSSKSVRSHFERLLLATEWGQERPNSSGSSTGQEANQNFSAATSWKKTESAETGAGTLPTEKNGNSSVSDLSAYLGMNAYLHDAEDENATNAAKTGEGGAEWEQERPNASGSSTAQEAPKNISGAGTLPTEMKRNNSVYALSAHLGMNAYLDAADGENTTNAAKTGAGGAEWEPDRPNASSSSTPHISAAKSWTKTDSAETGAGTLSTANNSTSSVLNLSAYLGMNAYLYDDEGENNQSPAGAGTLTTEKNRKNQFLVFPRTLV